MHSLVAPVLWKMVPMDRTSSHWPLSRTWSETAKLSFLAAEAGGLLRVWYQFTASVSLSANIYPIMHTFQRAMRWRSLQKGWAVSLHCNPGLGTGMWFCCCCCFYSCRIEWVVYIDTHLKTWSLGWRDGSMVENIGCSSKGLRFNPNIHMAAVRNSSSRECDTLSHTDR